MDRQEPSALRRKASAAGLFVGLLFLLMAGMEVLVVIGFWPCLRLFLLLSLFLRPSLTGSVLLRRLSELADACPTFFLVLSRFGLVPFPAK
jgi:hypothetical protein